MAEFPATGYPAVVPVRIDTGYLVEYPADRPDSRSDRIPTEFDIRLDTGPVKIKSDVRSIANKNVQIILSNSVKKMWLIRLK